MRESYKKDLERAHRLLEQGRIEEARTACQPLLESPAEDGGALHIAGIIELKRGEPRLAVDMLARAVQERPSDPAVHNSLGEALRAAGEPDQAEHHLRYALHLDRTFAAAHLNLGLLLWNRGLVEDAVLCFRNVLAINPDFLDALRQLGRLCLEEGDAASAREHLARAVSLDASEASTMMLLGQAHWASGDTREALACHAAAAALEADNGLVHFHRACAAFELCRENEAIESLTRAMASSSPPRTVAQPIAAAGRLADIKAAIDAGDIVRIARDQRHKTGDTPRVLSMDADASVPEPLQPYTSEIFVARISPGLVLPGELVAMTADGRLFIDHILSGPRQRAYTSRFIMHTSDDGRLLLALPGNRRTVDGKCVLLGAAASHMEWLFECLARLWIVRQRPPLERLPLVVHSGLTRWQRELLQLMGYGEDRWIAVEEDTLLACGELHVPSLVGAGHFFAPGAIEHLRRTLRENIPAASDGPARVYLSRKAAHTRRLANEDDIASSLARHGFVSVDPFRRSAAELLSLLQSAEAIIGVQGAAMAHLFFAPPRARIGLIVAEGLQSTRYYGPSAVLGQDFALLLARADFASHPDHEECDVVLDPALLERFVAEL